MTVNLASLLTPICLFRNFFVTSKVENEVKVI